MPLDAEGAVVEDAPMGKASAAFGRLWRCGGLRAGAFVAVACAGFGLATCLDGPTHRLLHPDNRQSYMSNDLWRMLRSVGYLPAWAALAAVLVLHDRRRAGPALPAERRRPRRRGYLVLLVTAGAGAATAVCKILIRRLRPPTWTAWDGQYAFRAWSDKPLSTSGFGLPSSHATVAMAGMFLLCRMFPRAWPVFIALAAGCALSRVATRGHFVSDVAASAIVGWAVSSAAWHLLPGWRGSDHEPADAREPD